MEGSSSQSRVWNFPLCQSWIGEQWPLDGSRSPKQHLSMEKKVWMEPHPGHGCPLGNHIQVMVAIEGPDGCLCVTGFKIKV